MIPSSVRIFVCTEPQDMRRSFDALALAVKERLELDPQSGALFVFASKRGNRDEEGGPWGSEGPRGFSSAALGSASRAFPWVPVRGA